MKNDKTTKQSLARESEFKGKPVLGLFRDEADKFGLKFGTAKAALILAHGGDIKAFLAKHQKQAAPVAA